ncbi:hypothetical protein [Streptomyces sp. NPDC059063]|uniref:hypothetical protein n=1 Tax=unclassified Streptomyces TaxID=2593676 RepID=UPI0036ACBC03
MNITRHTTLLAPALLVAAVLAVGCDSSSKDDERDKGPDDAGATLPARGVDADDWQEGPAKPEEGTWYPYDMPAHCGIQYARFGGRWWELESVSTTSGGQVRGKPVRGTNVQPGYMALIGPGAASFEAAGLPSMDFAPTKDEPPKCA